MVSPGMRHQVLVLLAATWMVGCGSTSAKPSASPSISRFQSVDFDKAKDSLAIGRTLRLSGAASDDHGLQSWTLTLLDSAGNVLDMVARSAISGTDVSFDQANTYLSISNDGSWGPTGSYTVRLTVADIDGDTTHADLMIRAKGTGTGLVSQGVRQLGAQGAAPGSFLDLTRDSVWKSVPTSLGGDIDIVFGVDVDNTLALMSPSAAAGGFGLHWDILNSTAVAFSATPLRTTSAIEAAIEDGAVSQKVRAKNGWYAVKRLSTGNCAALELSGMTAGDSTATVSVEIFK